MTGAADRDWDDDLDRVVWDERVDQVDWDDDWEEPVWDDELVAVDWDEEVVWTEVKGGGPGGHVHRGLSVEELEFSKRMDLFVMTAFISFIGALWAIMGIFWWGLLIGVVGAVFAGCILTVIIIVISNEYEDEKMKAQAEAVLEDCSEAVEWDEKEGRGPASDGVGAPAARATGST